MPEPVPPVPESILKHQRDVRLKIMLPVLLPALLMLVTGIILIVLTMTDTLSEQQVGVTAVCCSIFCIFIPLVIVMLAADGVAFALTYGVGILAEWIIKPFTLARMYSDQGVSLAHQLSEQIGNFIINLRVHVARWRDIMLTLLNGGEETDE